MSDHREKSLNHVIPQADATFQNKKNHKMFHVVLIVIACIAMLCICMIIYAFRYNYFRLGSLHGGTIMDETYYVNIPHKGLYAYTPQGSLHRILRTPQFSSYLVGESKIFYVSKNQIYMISDGSKTKVLDLRDYDGVGYELITIENDELMFSYFEEGSEKAVYIDISTGREVATGIYEYNPPDKSELGDIIAATENYTYYVKTRGTSPCTLYCYSNVDAESWILYDGIEVYTAETDGTWFYTWYPLSGGNIACWKIVYDEEQKPYTLELIDEDITK